LLRNEEAAFLVSWSPAVSALTRYSCKNSLLAATRSSLLSSSARFTALLEAEKLHTPVLGPKKMVSGHFAMLPAKTFALNPYQAARRGLALSG